MLCKTKNIRRAEKGSRQMCMQACPLGSLPAEINASYDLHSQQIRQLCKLPKRQRLAPDSGGEAKSFDRLRYLLLRKTKLRAVVQAV